MLRNLNYDAVAVNKIIQKLNRFQNFLPKMVRQAPVSIITDSLARKIGAKIFSLSTELKICIELASRHLVPMKGYIKAAMWLDSHVERHRFSCKYLA